MVVLVTQSCPVDCSPPGSSVHRILQARILEWVAISFSKSRYSGNLSQYSKAIYDVQKSVALLYTNNKISKRGYKKIPIKIVPLKIKYLGNKLDQSGERMIC